MSAAGDDGSAGAITPDLVRRIAGLAALRLDDDEVRTLAGELADILAHFEFLKETESTEGHGDREGHAGTEGSVRLRADEPGADPLAEPPAGQAPEWRDGFFTVPRLMSHADGSDPDAPDPPSPPAGGSHDEGADDEPGHHEAGPDEGPS